MSKVCGRVVAPDGTPCWLQHTGYWINQHQTLITGLLALLAAGIAAYFLWRQISQEQSRHEELIQRKLRAVRAGLPIALSEIHEYADRCIDVLCHIAGKRTSTEDEYDHENELQILKSVPPVPDYPANAFKALQSTIEYADTTDAAALRRIIAFSQIQNSRFRSLVSRLVHNSDPSFVVTSSNIYNGVRDAIGMRLHAARAFDYGRETSEHIHDIGDADAAVNVLFNRGNEAVRTHVREHWPPDFPRDKPTELPTPRTA